MVRLVLMIEPDTLERLKDAQARRQVFSRSELVRQLIEEALERDEATEPKRAD